MAPPLALSSLPKKRRRLQTLLKDVCCDVLTTVENTQHQHFGLLNNEGDTHAPAITDDPEAGNEVIPHRAAFWERCKLLDKLTDAADIVPGDNRPGPFRAGKIPVQVA